MEDHIRFIVYRDKEILTIDDSGQIHIAAGVTAETLAEALVYLTKEFQLFAFTSLHYRAEPTGLYLNT